MFEWFRRERWAQLKTVTLGGVTWGAKTGGSMYIHLFESDKGHRKIEVACSFVGVSPEISHRYVKSTEYYQKTLLRWLNGRYDPEIPRYSDIPEEDTANALKGKAD